MQYDIAIVGAGPAGATFARRMSGKGLKILLIDGQTKENQKPCGGLLAPDTQKALANFDLTLPKSVLVDPQIFSVKTIDVCAGIIKYYPRHYLNVDRYAFDKWLLSLVGEDVEVINAHCMSVERVDCGYRLELMSGGERRDISAKYIVGADGASSVVRTRLFGRDVMHYVAIQQWFKASSEMNPFYSCVFDRQTSESCSWSINKDGYFIFGGCFAPSGCRAAFEEQKKRVSQIFGVDFSLPVKTEACITLRPKRMSDFKTGDGSAFLIGEAAGFISPSSFEGISSAITSGSMLADSFDISGDIQRSYRKMTSKIRCKLMVKTVKRWFMYTPQVRRLIMLSGVQSIEPKLK